MNFDECLTEIEDRSAALRSAAADASDAPDLQAAVPGCPDWTLGDLIAHVGGVQLFWAAVVRAGAVPDPRPDTTPQGDLLEWSEASTHTLVEALREVGPDKPCWTWWEPSGAPQTTGAVARHQVQEAAVHAWDAMETTEKPSPLPSPIALDAIDEFLVVSLGSEGAWPHPAARLALVADEGRSWAVDLSGAGAAVVPANGSAPTTTVQGTASDLLLALFGRVPTSRLRIQGDPTVFDRILDWADTE
jgi:uncharacterized protein (TIGR03083 family)